MLQSAHARLLNRFNAPISRSLPLRTATLYRPPSLHLRGAWSRASTTSAAQGTQPAALAYSRADLLAWWHRTAREVSQGDLQWEARDHIDVRCTILKADGSVEQPKDTMSKQDMIDQFGLQPRDLRSLDAHILDVRPSLLVSKRSIILTTPVVRAIIAHDRVVLIGVDPKNPLVSEEEADELVRSVQKLMKYLEVVAVASKNGSAGGGTATFEFRALEALLFLTVRGFKAVASDLQERVNALIPELRFGISPAELRNLLECKRTVDDCLYSGRALQHAVAAVLQEDEDLAGMYLTDKHNGANRPVADHLAAELLLEYYERRLDETNESSLRLASLLDDVDANMTLVLASTRVRLQNLEVQIALSTLSLGFGATFFGLYGMNLHSGIEGSPTAFATVSAVGLTTMAAILGLGWVRLVRARRSHLFLGSAIREGQRKAGEGRSAGGVPVGLGGNSSVGAMGRNGMVEREKQREKNGKKSAEEGRESKKDGTEI